MPRILIVDDDSTIVISLGMLLKRAGYTCISARSEADALEKVRKSMKYGEAEGIDLII